jgi:hypothetical protein
MSVAFAAVMALPRAIAIAKETDHLPITIAMETAS